MKHKAITSGTEIDWLGCNHHLGDLPYRAIVPIRRHLANGPMLFQVAGSNLSASGARKALIEATRLHGGYCFYCKQAIARGDKNAFSVDHVEPTALGGASHLGNLVIACKPCNQKKGHQPLDSFNPTATRGWLTDLRNHIDARLNRLP
jgi:hypothetical protein